MAKIVRCREVGVDCDFEARGATEEEVLDKAAEHGRTAHGIEVLAPEPGRESPRRDPRGIRTSAISESLEFQVRFESWTVIQPRRTEVKELSRYRLIVNVKTQSLHSRNFTLP